MENNNLNKDQKKIRLDKWLWAARFYKTRAIAHQMIEGGKVHYNHQRCKPGKLVEIGSLITLKQGDDEKQIIVLGLENQRRSASEAQKLYQETDESLIKRERNQLTRKLNALGFLSPQHKPTKKERRKLLNFKNQFGDN